MENLNCGTTSSNEHSTALPCFLASATALATYCTYCMVLALRTSGPSCSVVHWPRRWVYVLWLVRNRVVWKTLSSHWLKVSIFEIVSQQELTTSSHITMIMDWNGASSNKELRYHQCQQGYRLYFCQSRVSDSAIGVAIVIFWDENSCVGMLLPKWHNVLNGLRKAHP